MIYKEKGITLISLVITIIILLVLSGVTISALTKTDLIDKALQTKEQNKITELQQKLELEKTQITSEKGEVDISIDTYINYISKKGIIDKNKDLIETNQQNGKYLLMESKYIFLIEKDTGELKITYQGILGKTKPILEEIKVIENDTNSIKVQVNAKLTKNPIYKFYITEQNGEYGNSQVEQNDNEYKFVNLKQGQSYKIKVEVKEKDGDSVEGEVQVTTGVVDGLTETNTTFTYEPNSLTNKNIIISISTTVKGYTLQYKTEKTGKLGEVSDWTDYTKEITLSRNQDIYARVIDTTGQYNGYATGSIRNIDTLPPKAFSLTAQSTTKSITVSANTTDAEATADSACSGMQGYRFSKDNGKTWTNYQTSGTYTFANLYGALEGTSYNIVVEAKDKVGNTTVAKITKSTLKNSNYYVAEANKLLCTIGGRNYYKYNSKGAIAGLAYIYCDNKKMYLPPVLVSTDPTAVVYLTSDSGNTQFGSATTINYGGVTYYCSSNGYWMYQDPGYKTNIKVLNTNTTYFSDGSAGAQSSINGIKEAAKILLDNYYK